MALTIEGGRFHCTTSDASFGPYWDPVEDALRFQDWLRLKEKGDGSGDPRQFGKELDALVEEWRAEDKPREPTGRTQILEWHRDEAVRERDGEKPRCAGCRRQIASLANLYRCVECGMAFHLACIRRHFELHKGSHEGGS